MVENLVARLSNFYVSIYDISFPLPSPQRSLRLFRATCAELTAGVGGMTIFDIIMLSLIQGVTEFLPISSSGHLVLWPLLTGRADQGATMDVAVHLGTLIAVCLYFRADVGRLAVGTVQILGGERKSAEARLALLICLATLPAVVVGFLLEVTGASDGLRSVEVIGWATLIGGGFLWLADRWGREVRTGDAWNARDALTMGLAQAVALIPGVSRSGVTMTAARAMGYRRDEAARLSLLMAVPVIVAAGTAKLVGVIRAGDLALGAGLALGVALSCISALAALGVMMRMFRADWTMTPFVVYRLVLGAVLLGIAYL